MRGVIRGCALGALFWGALIYAAYRVGAFDHLLGGM